jgi:hypothetical protein
VFDSIVEDFYNREYMKEVLKYLDSKAAIGLLAPYTVGGSHVHEHPTVMTATSNQEVFKRVIEPEVQRLCNNTANITLFESGGAIVMVFYVNSLDKAYFKRKQAANKEHGQG